MTILSVCQDAATELTGAAITTVFSDTDLFLRELLLQARKTADAILKEYDWQALKTLYTLSGDATNTDFALPSDYDRMPLKSNLFSSNFGRRIAPVRDLDAALYDAVTGINTVYGQWQILGGLMQVSPAMAVGETAKFYYVSKNVVASAGGARKAAFTADDDTFVLSERLLTLGIVWRWRAMKRLEYAEDMQNFEIAQGQEIARDKGSRMLVAGPMRLPIDTEFAFPGAIIP